MRYWWYIAGACYYNSLGETFYNTYGWRNVSEVFNPYSDYYVPDTLLLMKGIPLK